MIVNWTDGSLADLEGIRDFIFKENPTAAKQVTLSIIATGESLAEMSLRGRKGQVAGTFELVLTKLPYTIAYCIDGDRLDILRVIHHARKWPEKL